VCWTSDSGAQKIAAGAAQDDAVGQDLQHPEAVADDERPGQP
jgi:hypothetical protein